MSTEKIKCKLFGIHNYEFNRIRNSLTTGNSVFIYKCSRCEKKKEETIY